MIWLTLLFAVGLAWFERYHQERALKACCLLSALVYCVYVLLDSLSTEYTFDYTLYLAIDLVWLGLMYSFGAPALAVMAISANVMLGALLLAEPNHWLLFGYYSWFYVGIQIVLLASLTVLPWRFPALAKGPRPFSIFWEDQDKLLSQAVPDSSGSPPPDSAPSAPH